jgi:hypothetical protein
MASIVDLRFNTDYVVQTSSQLTWSSTTLGVTNAILFSYSGFTPPRYGTIRAANYSLTWSTGASFYYITFTYPVGSILMVNDASEEFINTSQLTFGPYQVNFPTSSRTVTLNLSATGTGLAPPPQINIDDPVLVFANFLQVGTIESINSTFSYSFPTEIIDIYMSYVMGDTPDFTRLIFQIVAPTLGLPNSTYNVQVWNINNQGFSIAMVISNMTIDYEPTGINTFNMTITVPVNGLAWTSSNSGVPGPNPNTTASIRQFGLSFPGTARSVYTLFHLVGGNLLSNVTVGGPPGFNVTSGSTVVPVNAVPSVSPTIITIEPFCIHPDSMVHTTGGLMRLGDLRSDQVIELIDLDNKPVKMLFNAKFVGSNKFVCYGVSSLGENSPSRDLLMTEGHPVFHNNREHVSKYMINGDTIKSVQQTVAFTYAPVTDRRTFVLINNVPVCTWALADLKAAGKKHGLYYELL